MELIGVDPQVVDELVKGRHAREVLELKKLKETYSGMSASPEGEHRSCEGLGRPIMSIPPLAFHYWGQRLGYDCWSDKQFRNEYLRDNPGARVTTSGGTRVQVGFSGNKRFVKSYGQ